MEMQELEIIIGQDGVVNVSVKGVTGTRCLEITEGLEKAVGKYNEREFTASYYQQDTVVDAQWCKGKVRTDPPS